MTMNAVLLAQVDGGGAGGIVILVVVLAVVIAMVAGMWALNEKAGEPGWAILVPIYNLVVALRIAGMSAWWILAMLIPLVSIIPALMMASNTAKNFGFGLGMTLGLILLPFIAYPVIGFGAARYQPVNRPELGRPRRNDPQFDDY
jgi:hypothetical protein